MKKIVLAVVVFLSWGFTQEAADLSTDQQDAFKEIGDKLRCPTCTGLSVMQSDASFSIQIREEVKKQIISGANEEDIMKFFTERYGLWILREPPKEGFHLLAWATPVGLLLGGIFLIWLAIWRKRQEVAGPSLRPASEILGEMERELNQLRGGQV